MDISAAFNDIFQMYRDRYAGIFRALYPSKIGSGFNERNMSANFSKAYERMFPSAITWLGIEFGRGDCLRYDALILERKKQRIVLIESIRFNQPIPKLKSTVTGIKKINQSRGQYFTDVASGIENFSEYTVYGLILGDVWSESAPKRRILDAFRSGRFEEKLIAPRMTAEKPFRLNAQYCVGDFNEFYDPLPNYHLLAMFWRII